MMSQVLLSVHLVSQTQWLGPLPQDYSYHLQLLDFHPAKKKEKCKQQKNKNARTNSKGKEISNVTNTGNIPVVVVQWHQEFN